MPSMTERGERRTIRLNERTEITLDVVLGILACLVVMVAVGIVASVFAEHLVGFLNGIDWNP